MVSSVTRVFSLFAALLVLTIGVLAWALDRGWFEISLAELIDRYELPDSRFVDVDGVRVHYVDQGRGSPVVILHASYLSLRSWDAAAELLTSAYRVIRFDLSGAGLTGADPTGRYGVDRNIELVQGVMATLNLNAVALVGTSSGGISAFRMAARFPEQVTRLVLINSAGMPRTAATNPIRPRSGPVSRWIQSRFRSRRFWETSMGENFAPPYAPSPELVQMTYDMNRREGGREISRLFLANFDSGDPQDVLSRVTAPTMVLWGLENRTVMHLEADVFAHWLSAAPTMVRKYPGLGHYPYIEEPEMISEDIAEFLAGGLDDQLDRPCDCGPIAQHPVTETTPVAASTY